MEMSSRLIMGSIISPARLPMCLGLPKQIMRRIRLSISASGKLYCVINE